jgi:hypothetical protein
MTNDPEGWAYQLGTLAKNWDTLAVEAYRGYLTDGRGALVIVWPRGERTYAPAAVIQQSRGEHDAGSGEMMRSYDPETEIVCVLMLADGSVSAHRIVTPESGRTPAALYRRQHVTPSA